MEEGSLHEAHCSDPHLQRRRDTGDKCRFGMKFYNWECYNEVKTKTRQNPFQHLSSFRDDQMSEELGKQVIFEHVNSVYVQENALLLLSQCIRIGLL